MSGDHFRVRFTVKIFLKSGLYFLIFNILHIERTKKRPSLNAAPSALRSVILISVPFIMRLFNFQFMLLLLLITRPLPKDGGMAEDHGAPEAGQLPRVWTRGHRETESRQRVSAAKSP